MAAIPDVLEASPLILVRWRTEDVDDVLDAVRSSFAELRQWMPWAQTVPTRDEQRAVFAEGNAAFDAGTEFQFVFRESATGTLVGGGGVHRRVGPGAVEIGYWVRTDRHNRGYATRAAQAMTDAALRTLEMLTASKSTWTATTSRAPESRRSSAIDSCAPRSVGSSRSPTLVRHLCGRRLVQVGLRFSALELASRGHASH